MTDRFSFDTTIDRRNSNSLKWDKYKDRDILPMWVADMDFAAPAPVVEALKRKVDQAVFGYNTPPEELINIICERLQSLYRWAVEPSDLVFIPGVVPALNQACRAFVAANEAVATATPIYYPFLDAPQHWGRSLYRMPCNNNQGSWSYPLELLESTLSSNPSISLLMLCNPFNPIGKVLGEDVLKEIVHICEKYNVIVVSDEIHCDLIFDGRQHVPTATVSNYALQSTITLMAATKTFNLAGLGGAFAIIQNPILRDKFEVAGKGIMSDVTMFGYQGMLTAFKDCEPWRLSLIEYLSNNRDYLSERIAQIKGVNMNDVEATYLALLDIQELKLDQPASFFEAAGLGFSDGVQFEAHGFMRMNFGCSRSTLETACDRLEAAILGIHNQH